MTGAGGDVLFVEATAMEGEQSLTLTGQLGDVMKESARIALSYVEGHAGDLDIDPALLEPPINVARLSAHPDGLARSIADFDVA